MTPSTRKKKFMVKLSTDLLLSGVPTTAVCRSFLKTASFPKVPESLALMKREYWFGKRLGFGKFQNMVSVLFRSLPRAFFNDPEFFWHHDDHGVLPFTINEVYNVSSIV